MIYPLKKGKLAKDQNEQIVLINPEGDIFATNQDLVITWQLCDGKIPLREIERLALKSEETSDDIQERFPTLLQRLASVNLVEMVPQTSM